MTRRVFFSFHHERDAWRAGQVRNCWVCKPDRESAGFWDAAEWEEVKKKGDDAVKRWIDRRIERTSVTIVLIGAETCEREWVRYEIQRSHERGNGIIGIRIHNLKDQNSQTDQPGDVDFGKIDGEHSFSDLYPIYDWEADNGYDNIGDWVEASALAAGRQELGPPSYTSRTTCGHRR